MLFKNTEEILRFAIDKEAAAASFYRELAHQSSKPWMREAFEEFVQEELGHQARLESILAGEAAPSAATAAVANLKIGDYLCEVEPSPDLDYSEALILAMKMEKLAFKLYTDVAAVTTDPAMKALLLSLAQDEARHKLRFELEYDQTVNQEN